MKDTRHTSIELIGVPLNLGAEHHGARVGPDALRNNGIVPKLMHSGLQIIDKGDITVGERSALSLGDPKMRYAAEIVRVCEETAVRTEAVMQRGNRAVVLGGDHTICLGAVAGASVGVRGDLGLIYIDAHGDMNTDKTTPTGNIHGMPLAALLGFGAPELVHVHGKQAKIQKQNLLHIGGSDFDQPELDLIAQQNLCAFTLQDLLLDGLRPLFALIDDLADRMENIWVSLDLDAINEQYAPGAGMPNPKGLLYREISAIVGYIHTRCNIIGVDVVEYDPLHDVQGKTAELAIELIATLFGAQYSWYTQYLARHALSS
jgi:arginase